MSQERVNVETMNHEQLSLFLRRFGLRRIAEIFHTHEINGVDFLQIPREDLMIDPIHATVVEAGILDHIRRKKTYSQETIARVTPEAELVQTARLATDDSTLLKVLDKLAANFLTHGDSDALKETFRASGSVDPMQSTRLDRFVDQAPRANVFGQSAGGSDAAANEDESEKQAFKKISFVSFQGAMNSTSDSAADSAAGAELSVADIARSMVSGFN